MHSTNSFGINPICNGVGLFLTQSPISNEVGPNPISDEVGFSPISNEVGFNPILNGVGLNPILNGVGFQSLHVDFKKIIGKFVSICFQDIANWVFGPFWDQKPNLATFERGGEGVRWVYVLSTRSGPLLSFCLST